MMYDVTYPQGILKQRMLLDVVFEPLPDEAFGTSDEAFR